MAVEVPATTAANYVVNLGAVGIVGVFFGMPMQDLVVGGKVLYEVVQFEPM